MSHQKKYRKILGELDQLGFIIHINRVCAKRYELQVNFEIVKLYRKRDSCNKYILKIHKKTTMAKEKKVAEIVEVPIHFILPDINNPRANYSEESCIELAKSMKERGLLQSIMVRPKADIEPLKYVVVYGHRRLWAAKYLKWETIQAQVKELSDDDAFEYQIIENLQREDINPMDESDAFQVLVKKGTFNAEAIADKLGKSTKYVYDRVILQQVIPVMQDAVRIGKYTITHAKQFARLSPEDQTKLWAAVSNRTSAEIDPAYIRRLINDTFKLKIGEAIFPTGDSKLVPLAGTCLKCQKRSGCRQLLFEDVQDEDVCFDFDCWKSKEIAHIDRLIEKYKSEGKEVKLLSCNYYPKDELLIKESDWRFHINDKETNIVGIIMEIPNWNQNKTRIGDIIWLDDSINKNANEEDDEQEVKNEYEGLSIEQTLIKKKEDGIIIRPFDAWPLVTEKMLLKITSSFSRGAFVVETTNQYLRHMILLKRLTNNTLAFLSKELGWGSIDIHDSEADRDLIKSIIESCGDDTDKLLELLVLVEMSRLATNNYGSLQEYNLLNKTFPDLDFHEAIAETEELTGIKLLE